MNKVAWPARFELLDGVRGVAALLVVLNHLQVVSGEVGHFAVMVFFVVSGYCIAASAESSRTRGLGFRGFMLRRIRRIYPPYLLAIAFFAATREVRMALGGEPFRRPILDWLQNLTLTQWMSTLIHPVASPMQNPKLFVVAFWSLNYEEQFYLVMAIAMTIAVGRNAKILPLTLILGLVGLAWNWVVPGGWSCGLFIEYWVPFALGSCLFYVLTQFSDTRPRVMFLAGSILIFTTAMGRLVYGGGDAFEALRAMTELAAAAAVALALFLIRPYSAAICRRPVWQPVSALGTISYSLYLIHQFNLTLVSTMARHLMPAAVPHAMLILTELTLFVALATLFWWFCERPFLSPKPTPGSHPGNCVGPDLGVA